LKKGKNRQKKLKEKESEKNATTTVLEGKRATEKNSGAVSGPAGGREITKKRRGERGEKEFLTAKAGANADPGPLRREKRGSSRKRKNGERSEVLRCGNKKLRLPDESFWSSPKKESKS